MEFEVLPLAAELKLILAIWPENVNDFVPITVPFQLIVTTVERGAEAGCATDNP